MAKRHAEPYRLFKRGSTYHAYISYIVDGERVQLRESCKTSVEQEAIKYCIERLSHLNKAPKASNGPVRIKIDEGFGMFYEKHAQYYARPAETLRKLLLIQKNITVKYIDEIDTRELSDYIARRKSYVSNATINRELVIISSLLTKMRLWKYKTSDAKPIKLKLKEKAENIKYLKDWEVAQKIIDRAKPHFRPYIYTALYTGFRRGNLLHLKWSELDFQNNLITVYVKDRTKDGGKILTIPMIEKLKEILLAQPRINDYVFNYRGKPISDYKHVWRSIFYKFVRIKKEEIKAEDFIEYRKVKVNKKSIMVPYKRILIDPALPYTNFHTLRHTAATWLLKETNNLKITQEILGHANITTTMKYAHIMADEKLNALNSVFK